MFTVASRRRTAAGRFGICKLRFRTCFLELFSFEIVYYWKPLENWFNFRNLTLITELHFISVSRQLFFLKMGLEGLLPTSCLHSFRLHSNEIIEENITDTWILLRQKMPFIAARFQNVKKALFCSLPQITIWSLQSRSSAQFWRCRRRKGLECCSWLKMIFWRLTLFSIL